MRPVESLWSFAKIADTTAQDKDRDHWRSISDDYLGALAGDFWRGQFRTVFHHPAGTRTKKPDTITREVVWRLLGPAKPPAFDGIPVDRFPIWEDLAKAKPEDYGVGLRNTILAQLLLREDDARNWIAQHETPKLRVGRPTQYNWDGFWREVVRVANTPDGLPDKQTALETAMLEWCDSTWGRQPAESTVRDKLSRLDCYS